MIYKVWLSVERCDEENDSYVTLGMPDELGVFAQPGHADLFAQSIVAAVDGLRAAIATEQKATEKESLLTAVTLLATSDFIPRRVANELQAAINQAEF